MRDAFSFSNRNRRFPTVEQRVFVLYGSKYCHLPADNEFLSLFQSEIRNNTNALGVPTIFSLKNNTLWPFIYLKRVLPVPLHF